MTKMFPLDHLELLAQASQPSGQSSGGFQPMFIVVWGLFLAAMWFLMIAPQRKKQKQHQKMLSDLKSGDEIITGGGIYGTITNVKDDRFTVRISDGAKIELSKSFVHQVVKKGD